MFAHAILRGKGLKIGRALLEDDIDKQPVSENEIHRIRTMDVKQ